MSVDRRQAERDAIVDELRLRLGEDWLRYLVETCTGIQNATHDERHVRWIDLGDGKQVLEISGLMTFAFQDGLGKLASNRRTGVRTAKHTIITSADHIHTRELTLSDDEVEQCDQAVEDARSRIGLGPRTPWPFTGTGGTD